MAGVALLCVLACFTASSLATLGVDISSGLCAGATPADWQCLVGQGYDFAIIQTWSGGYQWNSNIARCVKDAWNAGMKHVDVYAFMCPNCDGNSPPANAVRTIVNNLKNAGVNYGMLWFDVEQCQGCWNDYDSNCDFVQSAVNQAQSMGVHVGMYSSEGEWGQTVGTCARFTNLPLWYAHYDGQANFDDTWAYEFGGWTKPAMIQFQDSGPCMTVDSNWYP